jgi:hypothetical protein
MGLDLFQRIVISPASSTVLVLPDGTTPALLTLNDTSDPAVHPGTPDAEAPVRTDRIARRSTHRSRRE